MTCLCIVDSSPLALSARVGDVERLVLWLKRPVHHHAGVDRERLDNSYWLASVHASGNAPGWLAKPAGG